MKFIILLVAFCAFAYADNVEILKQVSDVGVKDWSYNVETSDGTAAEQVGVLKNIGKDEESISVQGSYSYIGPDGEKYVVHYVADENGFQPQGAHLPKAN